MMIDDDSGDAVETEEGDVHTSLPSTPAPPLQQRVKEGEHTTATKTTSLPIKGKVLKEKGVGSVSATVSRNNSANKSGRRGGFCKVSEGKEFGVLLRKTDNYLVNGEVGCSPKLGTVVMIMK
ncbi:uncharacterized protein ACRADG_013103 [Cochliomyia hominivorax]